MTNRTGGNARLPLIVIGVLVVIFGLVALALGNSSSLELGARGRYRPVATPSGSPTTRIVERRYECTATCVCNLHYPSSTPRSSSAPDPPVFRSSAEWTSCVEVKSQLGSDAQEACTKECQAAVPGTEIGSVSVVNTDCKRAGECS
jgi:hypothetical protein